MEDRGRTVRVVFPLNLNKFSGGLIGPGPFWDCDVTRKTNLSGS